MELLWKLMAKRVLIIEEAHLLQHIYKLNVLNFSHLLQYLLIQFIFLRESEVLWGILEDYDSIVSMHAVDLNTGKMVW
jgi:hypothetical protein